MRNVVKCPNCGCELLIIGNTSFTCFLCRTKWYGKGLLLHYDVRHINKTLAKLNTSDDDYWGE